MVNWLVLLCPPGLFFRFSFCGMLFSVPALELQFLVWVLVFFFFRLCTCFCYFILCFSSRIDGSIRIHKAKQLVLLLCPWTFLTWMISDFSLSIFSILHSIFWWTCLYALIRIYLENLGLKSTKCLLIENRSTLHHAVARWKV